jgi:hypothetical protein
MLNSSLLRLALALSLAGVGLSPAVAAPTGLTKPELASSATGIETVAYHHYHHRHHHHYYYYYYHHHHHHHHHYYGAYSGFAVGGYGGGGFQGGGGHGGGGHGGGHDHH